MGKNQNWQLNLDQQPRKKKDSNNGQCKSIPTEINIQKYKDSLFAVKKRLGECVDTENHKKYSQQKNDVNSNVTEIPFLSLLLFCYILLFHLKLQN